MQVYVSHVFRPCLALDRRGFLRGVRRDVCLHLCLCLYIFAYIRSELAFSLSATFLCTELSIRGREGGREGGRERERQRVCKAADEFGLRLFPCCSRTPYLLPPLGSWPCPFSGHHRVTHGCTRRAEEKVATRARPPLHPELSPPLSSKS